MKRWEFDRLAIFATGLGTLGFLFFTGPLFWDRPAVLAPSDSVQGAVDIRCAPDRRSVSFPNQVDAAVTCRDLAAQESMAKSTRIISELTWAQLLFAVLTLTGLLVTVRQTAAALRHARDEREENRRFRQQELRAYIGILETKVEAYEIGGRCIVRYRFKNFGSTPAKNVRRYSLMEMAEDGFPVEWTPDLPADLAFVNCNDIQPGGTTSFRITWSRLLTPEQDEAFTRRELATLLASAYVYDDVFGVTHVARMSEIRSGKALVDDRSNEAFFPVPHKDLPDRPPGLN